MDRLLCVVLLLPSVLHAAERPNLIIIMADDMGYSDIGCYGSEITTPSLDQLARDGLRFTQFYNTARCCPTRACLLTGLYPHQAGVGHMLADRGFDGYRGDLNDQCVTIAQVLKSAGYGTYMSGKWHVTRNWRDNQDESNWPRQRGFDRFFGTIQGAGSYFDPYTLTVDDDYIVPSKDFYYTDAISDRACQLIREHPGDSPFFMYVAYTAPHWPMHAKPEDIAKYQGKYHRGWEVLRQERYRRMVEMGLIDASWTLSPRDPRSPRWQDAERKDWQTSRMEVYAAMIDCMDQGVGRIIETLKTNDKFDNTLILFLADNGGCAEESGSRGPIKPDPKVPIQRQPMKADELQTRMIPKFTRDGLPIRTGRGVMPGPADTHIAYGLSWANASNTPFRLYKHWVHEGGISSPLIAHWPHGIAKDRHNQFERQPCHLIDLMATCVDLSGATYPKTWNRKAITPMQGVSLKPAFAGEQLERSAPLFWEHEGNRAIRMGKWKLVAKGPRGKWELYDLQADRSELHDLAQREPDRVQAMAQRWEEWAIQAKAKPWPYDPKPNKR